jgi:hypothetical protein
MKISTLTLRILSIVLLLFPVLATAQDADKQKLIEIEKSFAANPTAGPESVAVEKKYLYDGSLNQLTGTGRNGTLTKVRIIELSSKPDPSDPDVKTSAQVSDFHIDLYGPTALVSYKLTSTDTGHKDAALNTTDHYGCMDTFVKRNGNWYVIGNACAPSEPLPQSEWDAVKKAVAQQPKDVQEAYH